MDWKRFGLTGRPFPAIPDSAFYYPATGHEAAVDLLARAVAEDEGVSLLTGQPGIGKTLLCQCLLDRLGPKTTSAFLTNSHFPDRQALLQTILFELSLPYEGGSEQVLRLRLTEYLLKNCASGRRAVLLADEAQHLSPDHLEELRLLGNLEAGQGKALQVILVGQESVFATLARPDVAALNQRLVVKARLEVLGLEEAVDYLVHHLRLAGGQPEAIFDDAALEILGRGSRGVPRLLNQVGHQALTLAHAADLERVDAEAALEALCMLGLHADDGATALSSEKVDKALLATDSSAAEELAPAPSLSLATEETPVCRLYESPRRPA
jgi:type II secretory pathway predicted ATPase ExeA